MPTTKTLAFGDLIRHHRNKAGLSLSEFADIAKVNKGTISKIENGEVKKPEYRTIKILADALQIPYDEYIPHYVEAELSPDVLTQILNDAIKDNRPQSLISRISIKFLQSERLDSYDATAQLFETSREVTDSETKLTLLKTIINYSRGHGVMHFLARSLFQEYLIERNDFSKLHDTYQSGKYILKYTELLPAGEYAQLLYRLAGHAYAIRKYSDSAKYCKIFLEISEQETNDLRVYAVDILRGSYYHLGNYELAEKYSSEYRKCSPSVEGENDRLITAMLNGKRGNIELAIEQFDKCLQLCTDRFVVHTVNEYISLCFEYDHIVKIENLLVTYGRKIHAQIYTTPRERSELARFYKIKGDFYTQAESFNEAISEYIEGAYAYACIDDIDSERNCLRLVFQVSKKHNLTADVMDLIGDYYNRFKSTGGSI
ncbi:helix-turn-helix transcriptional regulator [Paenibacillus assamensis]|uniref:helix-turn-helix transcriptional regulator n=1 Tax=Paenibacillus assamensis TaxID=311244 RepID=UPI000411FDF6|nr:helix-turn-helix transcriptional regulator [Paenibacillus assamensis]